MAKQKKYVPVVKADVIRGRWQLTYKLTNSLGPEGFSGRNLASYPDPVTQKERFLIDANGRPTNGYWIDKQKIIFDPSNNRTHRLQLDFLMGHPLVGLQRKHIGQSNIDSSYFAGKEDNPKITLVNLDYEVVSDLKEEDYIDKLVGRISQDTGANSINLDKLRWISSYFGMNYRYDEVSGDPGIEKQKLKRSLKKFVRSSYSNAEKLNALLEDLTNAKYEYEIKEMLRLGILHIRNGMYMYNGNGLGVSKESVISLFLNDPELYAALNAQLESK